MLDVTILKLMLKEEFRLQASFFNRSYFLASSLVIMLFAFIMGLSIPMLKRVVAMDDILLVVHWIILFYGLGVGGFALFADRVLERRFGSISLLLGSGYTLPIHFRRLFFIFYIKDALYYIFLTILPIIVGLALASVIVPISLSSLLFLFVSLTLSFMLGMSFSVLVFTILMRWRGASILMVSIAAAAYLWIQMGHSGIEGKGIASRLPSLAFYYSHSFPLLLEVMIAAVVLAVISAFLMKEMPTPHERTAKEMYKKTAHMTSRLVSGYGPMLAKELIDLMRSGIIFPIVMTFLMPLIFLYAIIWFIESVMLWNFSFSLLFYATMVGFFCTLLYSWLSNIDISECYNSLPLSMPHVIRTKLILFLSLICIVAVPYLVAVGYIKGELELLWIALIIMFTVSIYVGSVLAYLTGLFTNSYLLDAKILLQFALVVVPPLVTETLLSFYYPLNNNVSILCISGLGILLVAASVMFLNRLDSRWKGKMFRIA